MNASPASELCLRDDASGLEATFVPGAGMLCRSLRHRGAELLAQNSGVAAYAEDGKTMGVPLLYPWANRLAAFDYTVAGRTVGVPHDRSRVAVDEHGLPIHGVIGGRLRWTPVQVGPGARSLQARLSWDGSQPELFEVFPFRHELLYEARLGDGRLEVDVSVHASGEDTVPVAYGFHPYLALPGAPREQWIVELPAMRRLALDADQIPVGPDQDLPDESFELAERQYDDGFDSLAEPARFAVSDGTTRISLEFLEGYPCAQVFAPPTGRFICFEPMTAPANAMRSGDGLRLLAPGERHRARFRVAVEELSGPGSAPGAGP
jgi:galactose mutarotase-like enzyme